MYFYHLKCIHIYRLNRINLYGRKLDRIHTDVHRCFKLVTENYNRMSQNVFLRVKWYSTQKNGPVKRVLFFLSFFFKKLIAWNGDLWIFFHINIFFLLIFLLTIKFFLIIQNSFWNFNRFFKYIIHYPRIHFPFNIFKVNMEIF